MYTQNDEPKTAKAKSAKNKAEHDAPSELQVSKTYKLFIGGAFPRTESGRYFPINDDKGQFLANVCRGSRKDFRNAVVAARKAQTPWQDRSAYNKAQILYRLAEMLQQKKDLFVKEMREMGLAKGRSEVEFSTAVDLLVYYAGWCDKYIQVFSAVNPVASSHFNFSIPEPTGVVVAVSSDDSPLVGMVQAMAPTIAGGNTAVILASETYPLTAITFAEVIATSDVPAGVVNILTGRRAELIHHFATHMDVNALAVWDASEADARQIVNDAAENVKRVHFYKTKEIHTGDPDYILNLQEIKTTWHPIENIKGSGSGY